MSAPTLRQLLHAAKNRRRVKLRSGITATLVYSPSPTGRYPKRMPRHGDPTTCGVRFDGGHRDTIRSIPPEDVIEILDEVES